MARIVVTSDLHYDDEIDLTPPETVAVLAARIEALSPDVVILAGDLGHPLHNFKGCLELFTGMKAAVGVVSGNHDIWKDPDDHPTSLELWRRELPNTVRQARMAWLEQDAIVLGSMVIVGTLGWYDYSAVDPRLELTREQIGDLKKHATNDSVWIDLPYRDYEFAAMLRQALVTRLDALEWDAAVDRVAVITHVPIFEAQMVRRVDEATWGLLRAFFGNPTTGAAVARYSKVRTVVSGHTHRPVDGIQIHRKGGPPISAYVVGSDYGEPAITVIDIDDIQGPAIIRPNGPPWFD